MDYEQCDTPLKTNFLLEPLQSPLFLTLCILISCGCGLSFLAGNIDVISILLTVFFWLTYAGARKNTVPQKQLRSISGTFFAAYIINFVAFGAIALLGFTYPILLLVGTVPFATTYWDIGGNEQGFQEIWEIITTSRVLLPIIVVAFLLVFLAIAVVGIILNILGFRKLHKFIQSLYLNAFSDEPILYKPATVRGWMIVLGIFTALSAVSSTDNLMTFLGHGAYSAAFFVGSVWIRKFFVKGATL